MSSLTGLISVAHLHNPYTDIVNLSDHTPKDPGRLKNGTITDYSFTKPLNATQQAQFSQQLELYLRGRDQVSLYNPKAHEYIGYCHTNPPFAHALATAAAAFPAHSSMPSSTHTTKNPLAQEEPWLAAWPWLPEPVRAALRPHLPTLWRLQARLLLTLIDEQATIPPASLWSRQAMPGIITEWITRGTPVSQTEFIDFLDQSCRPSSKLPLYIRTLLRWSDTAQLDYILGSPQHLRYRHAAFWCAMSSQALIEQALRETPLPYTERYYWGRDLPHLPWHAAIDPTVTLDLEPGRDALFHLGIWARLRPYDAPLLRISRTPAVIETLEREAQGPYADLAALIHQRLTPHSDAAHSDNQLPVVAFPASHKETEALLRDPQTPLPVLAACLDVTMRESGGSHPLEEALAAHPNLSDAFIDRLVHHPSRNLRFGMASSSRLTEAHKDILLGYNDIGIRIEILKRQPLSTDDIQQLLVDKEPQIRAFLAKRVTLPPSVIDVLICDPTHYVRAALLEHQTIPSRLLDGLIQDGDRWELVLAARQSTCTEDQLERLSHDPSWHVLETVAENPNASRETVERLAAKSPKRLGQILVAHPNLTPQTRIKLTLMHA